MTRRFTFLAALAALFVAGSSSGNRVANNPGAASGGGFDSVVFDGSAYLERATDFAGIADSKTGTFSIWIKPDADGSDERILESAFTRIEFLKATGNRFRLRGENTVGGGLLNIQSSLNSVPAGSWTHVMASWDLATATTHLYINGASDNIETTATDGEIDMTGRLPWRMGASGGLTAADFFSGKMLLPYFSTSYMDLGDPAERAKLYNGTALVDPAGAAPPAVILLKGDAATYTTNSGTGGDFTLTGTLTDGSDTP